MNPENIGDHIVLKHSSLWRKPLQYEKPVASTQKCHHQLNQSNLSLTQLLPQDKTGEPETTPYSFAPQLTGLALPSRTKATRGSSTICWRIKISNLTFKDRL